MAPILEALKKETPLPEGTAYVPEEPLYGDRQEARAGLLDSLLDIAMESLGDFMLS